MVSVSMTIVPSAFLLIFPSRLTG
ncbi:hypothetical protein E2C01_085400 [Portunus trituberculatus]|uniref:Uncharacterized protein n=1 Tax=Portunus trituberculatus TaxID=210409 RepID=A0A5B7J7H9_PORTR|nr:hypothetical protein [Portunus trituberculatus]